MKKMIEVTAKKVDGAIAEGLRILDLTIDEVDVKVVNQGGLFRKAVVQLYYGQDVEESESKEEVKTDENKKPEKDKLDSKPAKQDKPAKFVKSEKTVAPAVNAETGVKNEKASVAAEPQTSAAKSENVKKGKNKKERECIPATPAQAEQATAFLTKTVELMGIDAEISVSDNDGLHYEIGTDNTRVIGFRGEVLDALQYLTSMVINGYNERYVHITTDALGYRNKRKASLENLAKRMAERAVKTKRKVVLEPMNSADRKIIHAALSENESVFTRSEGHEPMRRIVILSKRDK